MPPRRYKRIYPYRPDNPVPPGWLLRDYLEAWGYTPSDFARRHSLPAELVEGIQDGSAPLDAKFAAILEREFDLEASFWLDFEAEYRRRLAAKATSAPHAPAPARHHQALTEQTPSCP